MLLDAGGKLCDVVLVVFVELLGVPGLLRDRADVVATPPPVSGEVEVGLLLQVVVMVVVARPGKVVRPTPADPGGPPGGRCCCCRAVAARWDSAAASRASPPGTWLLCTF